jgi:RimJ/RimL family protein N-acetyltransferase
MRLATDGGQVTLRRAAIEDVLIIFEWQRHPETRRFARNPFAPEIEEHRRWFETRLSSKDCMLYIVQHNREPSGVLRFDRIIGYRFDAWEVSIFVAPNKKRLGIAEAALDLGRWLLPEAELVAEVLPENKASHRLFRKAGYILGLDGNYHQDPIRRGFRKLTDD